MTNPVLGNYTLKPYFATVMQIFIEMQSLFRAPGAITAIGRRCPRHVRERWFYMVDTLAFICSHVDLITSYATTHESPFKGIPTELFEVYAILLPFACFVRTVEMRTCSLAMIVPLARQLLVSLSDAGGLMRTCTAMAILRRMQVWLLARLSVNHLHEDLVAYSLALS
jgi:hypothetical protein